MEAKLDNGPPERTLTRDAIALRYAALIAVSDDTSETVIAIQSNIQILGLSAFWYCRAYFWNAGLGVQMVRKGAEARADGYLAHVPKNGTCSIKGIPAVLRRITLRYSALSLCPQ
jgi:hypothetical protein